MIAPIIMACMLTAYSSQNIESLVNRYRTNNDRAVLIESTKTCDIAQKRATEALDDWSHDGFWKYAEDGMGENLARNFDSEMDMVDGWIKSPSHNKNLLEDYKFGCVRCVDTTCAHIFSK